MKSWIKAFRLRTLPLAISGWMVGTSIAANEAELSFLISGLTLLTAIFLQILSNLANDFGDASSGVDKERKGEERMVSSGKITANAMKNAMIIFGLLSLISGIILVAIAFPEDWKSALIFIAVGLIGIAAAIKYTVGKNPYGYVGFGDIFVFLFFGIVLVFGTYYLQAKELNWLVMLPAISIGLFSVGVLNVNNIRDIESDKAAGKISVPVRLGRKKAVIYHIFLLGGGMLSSIVFVLFNFQSYLPLLFVLIMVFFIKNIRAVRNKPANELDPYLKQMAISTFLFSILFSLGMLLT
ncbi:1,4-dihydroxy-2-naphthoate octaprenyltransferase [Ekhidna sp. To15]|uniref:1,4-dihydroxy-2-naphthoate octaprenyltransferase n=1 Tax=Ekhidna sp. To15 TaxID=3395267 RepID=UPI003F520F00